jgi:hypothetical protein
MSKSKSKGKSKSKSGKSVKVPGLRARLAPVVRGPQMSLPRNAIPLEPYQSENAKLRGASNGMHPVVSMRIAPALLAAADKRAAIDQEKAGAWPRITRTTVIAAALSKYLGVA